LTESVNDMLALLQALLAATGILFGVAAIIVCWVQFCRFRQSTLVRIAYRLSDESLREYDSVHFQQEVLHVLEEELIVIPTVR